MKIFATSILVAFSANFLVTPTIGHAAIIGKTQLLPTSYPVDDSAVVSSVGVSRKSSIVRVGSVMSFVPYYYLAQNKGTGGSITPSNFYATLSYMAKDPGGKELSVGNGTMDVVGQGAITQSATERVVQQTQTAGVAVWFLTEKIGTYSFTVWHDFNENKKLDASETSVTVYQSVYDYGVPTFSLTNYGSGIGSLSQASYGILTKFCITTNSQNSGLNLGETIDVVSSSPATEKFGYVSKWNNGIFEMVDAANVSSYVLNSENFNDLGCAFINRYSSAATPGSVTLTFTGLGGLVKDIVKTITNVYINASIYPEVSGANRVVTNSNNLIGTYSASSNAIASNTGVAGTIFDIGIPVGITTSVKISTVTEAGVPNVSGKSLLMRVVDTDGKITGLKGASYVVTVATGSNAIAPYTVDSSFYATLNRGESYMVYVQGTDSLAGGALTGTVAVRVKPQERFAKSLLAAPTYIRSTPGATTEVVMYVKDQFNTLLPSIPVIPVITGRNSASANTNAYLSDSLGRIKFNLMDVATDSTSMTDIITGKDMYGVTLLGNGPTINYGAFQKVSDIKITGAATEDKSGEYTKNYIDASYAGASNTTVKMTATLYDANGNLLPAGIKVNWSTKGLESKTGIPTDTTTGMDYTSTFTDSSGQAITYVYSLGTGDVDVYATYDGVTSAIPGKIHFVNAPTDARVVSATTTEGWIKAHVEDRYGNPVQGVDLTISRVSGNGYIPGNATTKVNALTDRDGNIEFPVTGGDAAFEVSTTVDQYGQTSSLAGYVNGISVSSSTIGGLLTPAGVSKVTIDVKSKDQNAEALVANKVAVDAADKANAASNLAAEKADNAILKAQEVQEAVAELATNTLTSVKLIRAQMDKIYAIILKISKKIG